MLETRWKYGASTAWQEFDGEVVVIELVSGTTMGLNPTGSFVWTRLATQTPLEIASALAANFGRAVDEAASDVKEFITSLSVRGLIHEAS